MKYEKPQAEIIMFDFAEFMAASLGPGETCTGYSDGHGHTCGSYVSGSSCSSFTSTSFGGATCNNYDGHHCYSYTDASHPANNPCNNYAYSCGNF